MPAAGRWHRSWPCPPAAVSTSTSASRRPGRRTCRPLCCSNRSVLADQGLDLVPTHQARVLRADGRDPGPLQAARRDPASVPDGRRTVRQPAPDGPGTRGHVFSQESLAAAGPHQIRAARWRPVGTARCTWCDRAGTWPASSPPRGRSELKAGGNDDLPALPAAGTGRWSRRGGDGPLDPPRPPRGRGPLGGGGLRRPRPRRDRAAGRQPDRLPARAVRQRPRGRPGPVEPEETPSNSSLGQVQAEVLRRVNAELPEEVHRRYVYGDVVKRSFGAQVLGAQERQRILVPAKFGPWCEEVAERQIGDRQAATSSRARSRTCAAPTRPSHEGDPRPTARWRPRSRRWPHPDPGRSRATPGRGRGNVRRSAEKAGARSARAPVGCCGASGREPGRMSQPARAWGSH